MKLSIHNGTKAKKYFLSIASLRISMFREFPYLYEGSIDDEALYLETYFKSNSSVILIAQDKENIVGFSTGILLSEEMEPLRLPFERLNCRLESYYYIGEVMILPEYRGRGIMTSWMKFHEKQARILQCSHSIFMTVQRSLSHPLRPLNALSLDHIWNRYGYHKLLEPKIHMKWRQIDSHKEEENILDIWEKKL